MPLMAVTASAAAWFAVAEATGWEFAHAMAWVHLAVACMAADALV